jgi:Flp pilus assembly protein TadG
VRNLIGRRLNASDEDGVTLVIVALCLIALFGMLVLVVDVGGLLLNRREMVNASDAAALSAAKSCILPASKDQFGTAEDAADAYALDNTPRAKVSGTNIIDQSGCETKGNGWVTVRYSADQHLFFAPVLGGGGNGQVTTQATAIFGPAGRASPLPIVLYDQAFNNCKLQQQPDPDATCYVWEDNSNTQGPQASFGLLDLRTDDPTSYGWDSNPGVSCSNPGNGPDQWINNYQGGTLPDLPVHWPAPTYVCRVGGFQSNAWADLEKLVDDDDVADLNDEEDILFFPLNRCEPVLDGSQGGQIARISTSQWQEVPCPVTPTQFDIIGFVAAKLIQIYDPNDVPAPGGTCESDQTILQGAQNEVIFDIGALVSNGGSSSCPTGAPDSVTSGPTITKVQNSAPGPQPQGCVSVPAAGCDYSYANGFITWSRSGPANEGPDPFRITFSWQNDGVCGIPPAGNNSGHCLILQPVDVQVGGGGPGTGSPDSNVRSYKLCDPALGPESCAPIQVPVP